MWHFDSDVRIVNIGDLHRGNKQCNAKFFQELVIKIAADKNTYWLSTGDLLEVGLSNSASGSYNCLTVDEELDLLTQELEPIKDKCLGIVSSNHHNRLKKTTGMSLDTRLCKEIGIPYLGHTGVIGVRCDKAKYFLVLHHGTGGGRTMGAKLNSAERLQRIMASGDVYLTGHTHSFACIPFHQSIIDKKRDRAITYTSYHVVTGHFMEYEDSYAEGMLLNPAPVGSSVIKLGAAAVGNYTNKRVDVSFVTPHNLCDF